MALLRAAAIAGASSAARCVWAPAPRSFRAPGALIEGRVARLDLPAYLALWQQIAAAQTLPPVQARLSTAELIAGRAYGEASVAATGITGGRR